MATKRKTVRKAPVTSSSRKTVARKAPVDQMETYQMQPQRSGPSMVLVLLLIAISFFTGFLFFKVQNLEKGGGAAQQLDQQQQQAARPTELKITKPTSDEHWRGSKDAKFAIVEYSDLECPFCKQAHPTLQKLLSENEGKVAWVYRHFPLSFHPKAQKSAEAVECAADQGGNDAFWKMTDAIYEKMPDLELTGLAGVATGLGLDGNALQSCLDSGKFAQKVKDEQAEGAKAGVQATPSNVVYNVATGKTLLIEGALPYDQFKTQLDGFMAK